MLLLDTVEAAVLSAPVLSLPVVLVIATVMKCAIRMVTAVVT